MCEGIHGEQRRAVRVGDGRDEPAEAGSHLGAPGRRGDRRRVWRKLDLVDQFLLVPQGFEVVDPSFLAHGQALRS